MSQLCGYMTGRQVVPAEEMVAKIKAAKAARQDEDFQIIARTDARTVHGIDEALRRAELYQKAGADVLFIESPESVEEMQMITSAFDVPLLANMVEGGRTPLLKVDELEQIGFSLVIFPTASTYLAAGVILDLMKELMEKGTTEGLIDKMIPFEEFNKMIGLPKVRAIEAGEY